MRRFQTIIAIIFETRLRPCRIAVCAEGENNLLKDCFQVSMNKSMKKFSSAITLNSPLVLRLSENRTPKTEHRKPNTENRTPKTENRKPQTATQWPRAFPKRLPGPLQPPGFLKKGISKGFGSTGSLSQELSPLHHDPPNHALTPNVAKSKP